MRIENTDPNVHEKATCFRSSSIRESCGSAINCLAFLLINVRMVFMILEPCDQIIWKLSDIFHLFSNSNIQKLKWFIYSRRVIICLNKVLRNVQLSRFVSFKLLHEDYTFYFISGFLLLIIRQLKDRLCNDFSTTRILLHWSINYSINL